MHHKVLGRPVWTLLGIIYLLCCLFKFPFRDTEQRVGQNIAQRCGGNCKEYISHTAKFYLKWLRRKQQLSLTQSTEDLYLPPTASFPSRFQIPHLLCVF